MKNKFSAAFILLVYLAKAQSEFTSAQLQAQNTVKQLFEALSQRDSVQLKAVCSNDISLFEYGQVWNLDSLISRTITRNKAPDFTRSNSFHFISTHIDKTTATVLYRLESDIVRNGQKNNIKWLETVILVRNKKRWLVKHLHSTRLN